METTEALHGTLETAEGELSRAEAWKAVLARDETLDGILFYAVETTGIYCRPSCPARRPHPGNVQFFGSAEAAEESGFRSCLRCGPEATDHPPESVAAVERARAFLDEHLSDRVTLDALANEVGTSPHHLHRTFRRIVGLTPKAYQDAGRLARFRERLRGGDTVSRATFEAGFGSTRAVYEKADAALGMSPATYRRGAPGVTVRFASAETEYGSLVVAATAVGICFVGLVDPDQCPGPAEAPPRDLEREFPRAFLRSDPEGLASWVEAITEHLAGIREELDLPTDLPGTEFQMCVWRALKEIPFGSTRSYSELATAIGRPGSARAVARACATNRAALVVPCHRVVRKDGRLGGYRWGIELKEHLLREEGRKSLTGPE